jgi:hypothetical protein
MYSLRADQIAEYLTGRESVEMAATTDSQIPVGSTDLATFLEIIPKIEEYHLRVVGSLQSAALNALLIDRSLATEIAGRMVGAAKTSG